MHHLGKGKANKKATREMPEEDPEFQIAPMIDILLVLLVFFMSISSTEVLQRVEGENLPTATEAGAMQRTQGQVVLNVLWVLANDTGSIQMDGVTYARAEELVPALR